MSRHIAGFVILLDSLAALLLAVAAVVWANERRMPSGGLYEFLQMRITLMNASFAVVFACLWARCFDMLGVNRRPFVRIARPALLMLFGCAAMSALLGFYLRILHSPGPRGRVVAFFFITSLGYETVRMLVFTRPLHWQVAEPDSVLILGSGPRASKAWRELRTRHHDEKRLAGFIDDRDPDMMAPDVAARYLGKVDSLANILLNNVIDELIVAMPMRSCYALIQNAISLAEDAGVRVLCLNDFYCLAHNKKLRLRASLLTELVPRNHGVLFAELLKRIIDVTCAFAGLLLCIPLFIVIAASIKATSRGPVFFRQERFGYRRRHFRICKFRSMVCDADKLLAALEGRNEATGPIFKIRKDPRVTPLGRFLRRTSLDELPQLWNVLIGDMSLVGPRPMSMRDVSHFTEAQLLRRFSVRPGITGMWQIAGRASFNFDRWVALDCKYIDDWSLALDFRILAQTVPAVLRRSGAV